MKRQRKALSRRDIEKINIWEGAKALVQTNDRTAVPQLIRTLRTSGDVEKRTAAAYGLAWLNDRRGVKPLLSTLLNEKERPKVRGQAAEGLAYLFYFRPGARVFRALIATLSDPSAEVAFGLPLRWVNSGTSERFRH